MNFIAAPFAVPDNAPELARRFAMIMAGLGALIARRFVKMPHLSGFTVLLWSRLNRAVRRLHWALTQPQARARAKRARADHPDAARTRPVALPSGRGWIVRELGWEAAAFLGYLQTLLAEIETQAALAAAPGTGRILRPICRMLGVPAALTPRIIPPALTPRIIPAALTPKIIPAALTPRIVPSALTVKIAAKARAVGTGVGTHPAPGSVAPGAVNGAENIAPMAGGNFSDI